jgi:predicted metal-dependent hydrolase
MSERPAWLDAESAAQMRKGVDEFNAGKFFECHDTLEDVWRGIRGAGRDFLQGLIQVSVGFYHLDNANLRGAESQLGKGLQKLADYGDSYAGIDVRRLRDDVGSWLQKIHNGEPLAPTPPTIHPSADR